MIFTYRGIFGFDISTWQDSPAIPGHIDFNRMREYGASFVIVKASQGNFIDPDFPINWEGAKGKLPRSSYHYYDNRYAPKEQARKYWDVIRSDPEGICWLDLEDRTVSTYSGWKRWYDFLEEFKLVSGLPASRIGIYTNFFYWIENLRYASQATLDYFLYYPLWLASYPADPLHPYYASIKCPPPWDTPLILQSGTPAIGALAGVESKEIDYNQFNGDAALFERHFTVVPTSPEPPTEEEIDEMAIEAELQAINATLKEISGKLDKINTGGGGGTTPPASAVESVYQVIEKDANPNKMVIFYKTPDINETNVDRVPVPPAQTVHVVNSWRDVPADLVGWKAMSDIDKQNTYLEWVCVHETQIKQANGKWRAFPDIFLQGGTVRASYCWMLRSCMGAKVA